MIASRSAYSASSISGAAASPTGDQSVRRRNQIASPTQHERERETDDHAVAVVHGTTG